MNLNNRNKTPGSTSDEVEEMLREAEDAMLLKLSTNSHLAHLSSNLPSDLDRRFHGLKSGNKKPEKSTLPSASTTTINLKRDEAPPPVMSGNNDDDLFTRFATLKSSLPKPSSSADYSSFSVNPNAQPVQVSGNVNAETISVDDTEDEVEKLIKWAIDAARLDPSPSSDDDENDDKDSESNDEDEDEDEDYDRRKKGEKRTRK